MFGKQSIARIPTDQKIQGRLIGIISDGFNRSLNALRAAGEIDTKKMSKKYTGIGSEYYDLVTEQIECTAKWSAPAVRELFSEPKDESVKSETYAVAFGKKGDQ